MNGDERCTCQRTFVLSTILSFPNGAEEQQSQGKREREKETGYLGSMVEVMVTQNLQVDFGKSYTKSMSADKPPLYLLEYGLLIRPMIFRLSYRDRIDTRKDLATTGGSQQKKTGDGVFQYSHPVPRKCIVFGGASCTYSQM